MTGQLNFGLEVGGDDCVRADDDDGRIPTLNGAFWMATGGNYVFWVTVALIERQELSFACVGVWKVTGATPMLRSQLIA